MSRSPASAGALPHAHSRSRSHSVVRFVRTHTDGRVRSLPGLLVVATACAGSGLLVAACSSSSASGTEAAGLPAAPGHVAAPASRDKLAFSGAVGARVPGTATEAAKLAPNQDIIYTATVTLRVSDVNGAATAAVNDVTGVGGYVAGEHQVQATGRGTVGEVDLQLKIPVAAYHQTLAELAGLGAHLVFNEQAQDVTQEVADVTSRVASAEAAIRQLRQLLGRAGNVGQLLTVQDEINSQESALESLIAQQQALAHETTYATVDLTLLGHHAPPPKKHKKKTRHGLVAGLSTGWRALKLVVVWLLTALGTLLPFAIPVVAIGGIIYVGRRRVARRRTPPAAAPPAATS